MQVKAISQPSSRSEARTSTKAIAEGMRSTQTIRKPRRRVPWRPIPNVTKRARLVARLKRKGTPMDYATEAIRREVATLAHPAKPCR